MASAAGRDLLQSDPTAELHELATGIDSTITGAVSVADGSCPPAG